ncbi:MAG TPA: sigma-70 family RNA polymerase sigma factor [Phycisphaerales bacterium]|nr:sigma-70 family RNA polymerase sigma factor [Phycisphaerales bacterium]
MNSVRGPATSPSGRGREDAEGPASQPDLPGLLKAAGEGDDRAWRALVDLYARRVYALARSRLGGGRSPTPRGAGPFDQGHDAAEEVTQSVFVTVATKLGSGEYTEQGRFESWLFRVAMNRIRDEVRRLKRHAEPTDPEAFNEVSETRMGGSGRSLEGAAGQADESIRALRAAMGRLSDPDREIIELRHHAGLSFKQMADLLDEPLGTLLARHHRALRKLKELITASDPSLAITGEPS